MKLSIKPKSATTSPAKASKAKASAKKTKEKKISPKEAALIYLREEMLSISGNVDTTKLGECFGFEASERLIGKAGEFLKGRVKRLLGSTEKLLTKRGLL